MAIYYTTNSIFESDADILVNPVNCVGFMGAGLALQFKNKFPDMYESYRTACRKKYLGWGQVCYVFANTDEPENLTILRICLFPTKIHYNNPSDIALIEDNLIEFTETIPTDYNKISFPKLGCGLGGLDWKTQVQPLIHKHLDSLPNTIYIHVDSEGDFL